MKFCGAPKYTQLQCRKFKMSTRESFFNVSVRPGRKPDRYQDRQAWKEIVLTGD